MTDLFADMARLQKEIGEQSNAIKELRAQIDDQSETIEVLRATAFKDALAQHQSETNNDAVTQHEQIDGQSSHADGQSDAIEAKVDGAAATQ